MISAALPRTFLSLHLVHSGLSEDVAEIVRAFHSHYRDGEFDAVGGIGVDVRIWDLRSGLDLAALPLHSTQASVVCVFCDRVLVGEANLVGAVRELSQRLEPISPPSVLVPVFVDDVVDELGLWTTASEPRGSRRGRSRTRP